MSCMIRAEYELLEDSRGSKPRGGCSIAMTSKPGLPPRRQAPSGQATMIAVRPRITNLHTRERSPVFRANGRVLAPEELDVCSINPNQGCPAPEERNVSTWRLRTFSLSGLDQSDPISLQISRSSGPL